ncbi:hypothetical protein NHH03_11710 [Stieleria sp. TO1_6]|uniref:hypothetical protein n=1 Tax=Stieleria tagensis TaxID=2956795 RepID=UPI00209B2FA2|nr:hypothetical protein [Stieleria tagensis]MCO8122404.1 hypothetical protein [Stieleria tagensis]
MSFCNKYCRSQFAGFYGRCALFGLIVIAVSLPNRCRAADRWTSLDGSRTVEADFIGLWGNQVVLELAGQRRVSVSVDDLIAESRIQARRMGEDQQRRRSETMQQIHAAATEAAAPAPTPLPKPPTAPAYQPAIGVDGLLARLEWMDQQNRNGHGLIAAFDSLPPSQQSDLERMLRMSLEKINLRALQQALAAMHSIGELTVTHQRWVLSHPRVQALDDVAKENFRGMLLAVAGLLREGLNPELLKLEDLATVPLRSWLVDFDQRAAPRIAEIYQHLESMGVSQPAYEVQAEKDGQAAVVIRSGQSQQTVNYVSVDGLWVPQDLAGEKWTEAMKNWETGLDQLAQSAWISDTILQGLAMKIDTDLQPARSAQSAREFHVAMDGLIIQISPLIAQMGSVNLRSGRGGQSGGDYYGEMDDYEEEMRMQMEMEMEMGSGR